MRNSRVVLTISEENTANPELVFDFDQTKVAQAVCEKVLETEGCPYDAEISLTYTGDEEIRSINRDYREIDKVTDVLSFPMADYPVPGDFSDIEERDPDAFHPETGELILGDVIISMDKVKEQAKAYGHSNTRELAFLVAHSMLHLMGYDHMVEEERIVMERKQEEILKRCGYIREMES